MLRHHLEHTTTTMLPEQVEVWLDAIAAWGLQSARRLNAIMSRQQQHLYTLTVLTLGVATIIELANGDSPSRDKDVQTLSLALLDQVSLSDSREHIFLCGELHFYIAYMERRDGGFALQHLEMAEDCLGRGGTDAEHTWGWLHRVREVRQAISGGTEQQGKAVEGHGVAAEGVTGGGDEVEWAEEPVEAMTES